MPTRQLIIYSPTVFQPYGHQQSYIGGLSRALTGLGVEVHLFGWEGPVSYPHVREHRIRAGGGPKRRAELRKRWGLVGDALWGASRVSNEFLLARELRQLQRQLPEAPVLFETFEYVSLGTLLNAHFLPRSVRLCIFHDTNFNLNHASPVAAAYKRAARPFAASILKAVDRAFVHAPGMRENLLANLDPRRRLADKVSVLPHGAPHPDEVVHTPKDAARRELGLPPGRKLALAFGTLRSDKRLELTIAGLARAPDWDLVVAGPEGETTFDQLLRAAEQHGMTDRLRLFRGFIPPERHGVFFGAADVVINLYDPTIRHESGTAQLARTFLRPVVAGGPHDLLEYVREAGVGWTVEPLTAEALAATMEEVGSLNAGAWAELEQRLSRAAAARSWQAAARTLLNVLEG